MDAKTMNPRALATCGLCLDLVCADSTLAGGGRRWVMGADGREHWAPGQGEAPVRERGVCGERVLIARFSQRSV